MNTNKEYDVIDEIYPKLESISIDYGIMEKSQNVKVIPAEFGWSDVGSWDSLGVLYDEDENGNIYITYDFGRYEEREILMAKVTEADILAGEIVTPTSYLKRVVNRATGERAKY